MSLLRKFTNSAKGAFIKTSNAVSPSGGGGSPRSGEAAGSPPGSAGGTSKKFFGGSKQATSPPHSAGAASPPAAQQHHSQPASSTPPSPPASQPPPLQPAPQPKVQQQHGGGTGSPAAEHSAGGGGGDGGGGLAAPRAHHEGSGGSNNRLSSGGGGGGKSKISRPNSMVLSREHGGDGGSAAGGGRGGVRYSINDFHIDRTLGTGSFGRVHMVRLKSSGRFYAMKVLRKSEIVRMKQVEHTVNEKSILEKLDFPFLVSMLGTFQDSANIYFVLEYVQGGELFSYLRRCGRFPNNVARFYAAEVVLAFEYLHNRDIIYRDLKPENLLIDAAGHIKITDFGFAKHVPDVTWTLCGTPDYLAPEIIQSKGYGRAVDWWALGILIYEMLAGHPPFYDEDHFKLYEKILACRPKFPPHFDPMAKDLVKRLLTADLSKRYGNLRGGSGDIKRHKWFAGVDWEAMVALQVRAPYVPPSKGDGDTSNFDVYPEDHEPYGVSGPDPHKDKFKDF